MHGSKLKAGTVNHAIKKFFRQGTIRISREKERAIYFYATLLFLLAYLFHRLQGGG
jgi:hypothetical protein